jgi:hypothetical protein
LEYSKYAYKKPMAKQTRTNHQDSDTINCMFCKAKQFYL